MMSKDAMNRDWVGMFERRLARAGPSLPLHVFILNLFELSLPVIDVISGGAPDYVHLSRWETFDLKTFGALIRRNDPDCWGSIASLISQPMPSLKRLTLQQIKIDFHAFANAPNLEELNVLYCRSPRIGKRKSFRKLKTLHITYPPKYPLSFVPLRKFSRRSIETLIIGGYIDVGERVKGTYPSLSTLTLANRVPHGIVHMSAPILRHLKLCHNHLFCSIMDSKDNAQLKNREVLEILARTFPTVEVLEVHEDLRSLVSEMISNKIIFAGLKELRAASKHDPEMKDLKY